MLGFQSRRFTVLKGGENILHGDKLSYPGSPVLPLNLTLYVLLIRITINFLYNYLDESSEAGRKMAGAASSRISRQNRFQHS